MALVQRANVYLTVSEEELESYVAKGFNVIDEKTGAVIRQNVPTELGELQKAYSQHVKQIKELTSEIARLKSLLKTAGEKSPAAPEKKAAKVEKEESQPDAWDDWGSEEVKAEEKKPKKGKK